MSEYFLRIRDNWLEAWSSNAFRRKLIIGLLLNIPVFGALPFYFNYIQKRQGIMITDWVLSALPSADATWFLIILLWGGILFFSIRSFDKPIEMLTFVYSVALLTAFRITSIYFVPLDPPSNLVPLHDVLSNAMYFDGFKTKDLFFSGHESYLCLLAICAINKPDKWILSIGSAILGICLLIQHIHYTVDVLAAPLFAYMAYLIVKQTGVAEV